MTPQTGAQALISGLEELGVTKIFGYPGGAIMPVYDALVDSSLQHILVRHEQGAALAAGGYARVSGEVGVCLATSGPGATNLVTGIADAFMDSIPMVAITGQVPKSLMGTDAFQEVDIFGITLPIVKHSFVVQSAEEVHSVLQQAFAIAKKGRPGPVLIDFPKDVATATLGSTPDPLPHRGFVLPTPEADSLQRAARMISSARRPLIYAGGGIGRSGSQEAFRAFADHLQVPVVTTLHGIGALSTGHSLLLGMIGMHGSKAANLAVQNSDLLICLGARFDDRATGKLNRFAPNARVIHVDVDRAEFGKLRQAHVAIHCDLKSFFSGFELRALDVHDWREKCLTMHREDSFDYQAPGDSVFAPAFLHELTHAEPDRWVITCDVGQHQMWVAQHCCFAEPWQHVSSGGLGTMGFGLPAAIGAKLARPDRDVLTVTGDGSFLMNVQELATIRRYQLPIKIVVFDNSGLGLVRQWQTLFFEERFSEVDLSDNPDFTEVAQSFGIPALRCSKRDEVDEAIEALRHKEGPLLVHVPIDMRANVWPLVPPNQANHEMLEGKPCKTT